MFTKQLIKYGIVGTLGTLLDVASLYVFVEFFHFPILLGATCSFFLALTHNYILNRLWTFEYTSNNHRKLFLKFSIIALIGLSLTNASMFFFTSIVGLWYIYAKLVTSALVMMWNFLGNKHWTFRQPSPHPFTPSTLGLSIVIPAYNEEGRIRKTIEDIHMFLQSSPDISYEIIIVNDGSSDATERVSSLLQSQISALNILNHRENMGKGWAVRTGVLEAKGEHILVLDADGSTPIDAFHALSIALQSADIAIGSRYLSDSRIGISQSHLRTRIGRVGNTLIRWLILDDIRDTQCGFKLFTRKAAYQIFPRQKVRRWGYDMEILAIATLFDLHIVEVPVEWNHSPLSRLRPIRDACKTFTELLYIKFNLLSGRYRD